MECKAILNELLLADRSGLLVACQEAIIGGHGQESAFQYGAKMGFV